MTCKILLRFKEKKQPGEMNAIHLTSIQETDLQYSKPEHMASNEN